MVPLFKIPVRLFNEEGPFPYVLGINLVGDVHNPHIRIDGKNNPFHNACVGILQTKISEESDYFQGFTGKSS